MSDPVKGGGRVGSAPGYVLTVPSTPERPSRRWVWFVLAGILLLVGAAAAFVARSAHSAETFALTLDLKTPDGRRQLRVAAGEVTVEEIPKKGKPSTTNCALGLRDMLGLQSLVTTRLVDEGPDTAHSVGTYLRTGGASSEVSNGPLDAETAEAVSSYILKHSTGCVQQTE